MMIRTFKASMATLPMTLGLAGCGSVEVSKYRDQKPPFDLRTYFDGSDRRLGHVPGARW
ncbi:MAG: DUF3833 family protein [Burkholderiaceae bacterium]